MKICLDCDYTAPAKDSMGAERMIEALAKAFLAMGHEVVMRLYPDSTNTPAPLVSEIPKDCDIINFNGWIGREKHDAHGIPWVVTLHGGGSESDPQWMTEMYGNPNMICVSKFVADRIGCSAYAWSCSAPDDFIYQEKKENYFLWMAGTDWGEGKGLFSTIKIAKNLRIKLKIAGTGQNQANIELIKKLCDDKIEYVGAVNGEEKAKLLAGAKALILLSQVPDACPLTVSEAMLSGTPVIASDKGSLPEIIQPGAGFVCKNMAEVAKAILKTNNKMSPKCREVGETMFSNTATAKKYLQFYENMIEFGRVMR